jgi:glutathione synthase/RimK-type ligase-like ATP-grasp enzyme
VSWCGSSNEWADFVTKNDPSKFDKTSWSMNERTVILLSHAGEPYVTERVAEELRFRGARPIRLNTDRLFGTGRFGTSISPTDFGSVWFEGKRFDPEAIWLWRAWPQIRAEGMLEADLAVVNREAHSLFFGSLELFDVRWVDAPTKARAAENKLLQLRIAQEVGLRIPDTSYTSDPEAVRTIFDRHDGRIICKLHAPLDYAMRAQRSFPTRRFRREDLKHVEAVRFGPMIFQEEIPKALELRVAWAGGAAWTGAMRGDDSGVDWRHSKTGKFQAYTLDSTTKNKLGRLMKRLGLRQGCLDLILTPQGEMVFLEVNPTGEWGMLEAELGLPIAASLAETLLTDENAS